MSTVEIPDDVYFNQAYAAGGAQGVIVARTVAPHIARAAVVAELRSLAKNVYPEHKWVIGMLLCRADELERAAAPDHGPAAPTGGEG